jgi:gas vesicle protein
VGRPYSEQHDWVRVGFFGAGLVLGAMLGASAALLYAPQSGLETRMFIAGRARRMRARATDRWDELGAELRQAARRNKRRVRRGIVKSRWAAADSLDY